MNQGKLFALLASAAFAVPVLVGCEEKVAERKVETTTPAGTQSKQSETVTKDADGSVKKVEKKTVEDADGEGTSVKKTTKVDEDGDTNVDVDVDKKD